VTLFYLLGVFAQLRPGPSAAGRLLVSFTCFYFYFFYLI
jgi:hypothetical protein